MFIASILGIFFGLFFQLIADTLWRVGGGGLLLLFGLPIASVIYLISSIQLYRFKKSGFVGAMTVNIGLIIHFSYNLIYRGISLPELVIVSSATGFLIHRREVFLE